MALSKEKGGGYPIHPERLKAERNGGWNAFGALYEEVEADTIAAASEATRIFEGGAFDVRNLDLTQTSHPGFTADQWLELQEKHGKKRES